jgi:hypothetical protein
VAAKATALAKVFIFKFRVFALEFGAVGIGGEGLADARRTGTPETSNPWLAVDTDQGQL